MCVSGCLLVNAVRSRWVWDVQLRCGDTYHDVQTLGKSEEE
jgi:hypothetical protein